MTDSREELKMTELKPCADCGRLPNGEIVPGIEGKRYICWCSGRGYRSEKEWNSAYCWKEIDSLKEQVNKEQRAREEAETRLRGTEAALAEARRIIEKGK